MEVDTDIHVLQQLADGKSCDDELWPDLLKRLILRLQKIVQEEFQGQKSKWQASEISSSPTLPPAGSTKSPIKENVEPTTTTLHPAMSKLLLDIIGTLKELFHNHPPHTIQRLAELILAPRAHYRTLPSYLHALDRVVHVTSPASLFPLPPAVPDPSSLSLLCNGTSSPIMDPLSISWSKSMTSSAAASTLGSDESLGGALLTPIAWLAKSGSRSPLEGEVRTESTEMIDGPNGPGGVETVTVSVNGVPSTVSTSDDLVASLRAEGGITQGELLRQEQQAGVVPATQLQVGDSIENDGETPHARGPEDIGMEDMGPQHVIERKGLITGMQGIDVEAAVGRRLAQKTSDDAEAEGEGEIEEETRLVDEEAGGGLEEERKLKKDLISDEDDKVSSPPSTPKREAEELLDHPSSKRRKGDAGSQILDESKARTIVANVILVDTDVTKAEGGNVVPTNTPDVDAAAA